MRAAEETSRSPGSWPLTVAGSRSGVVELPLVNPHATCEVRHGTHHPMTSCALCLTSFCRAATRWTALMGARGCPFVRRGGCDHQLGPGGGFSRLSAHQARSLVSCWAGCV